MKRDAVVLQNDQHLGPDPDFCRSAYDQALGYARFVQARLDKALDVGIPSRVTVPQQRDPIGLRPNLCDLINDFAQANAELDKRYWRLLDAMDWDEDEAKDAGITERQVFMRGYKQVMAEARERERKFWYEHDCVEGQ